ncbi:MAG: DUF445 domain-containing protein [Acetobacter sp.]
MRRCGTREQDAISGLMMLNPDPDLEARRALVRHKRLATGLLGGMMGLTIVTCLPVLRPFLPAGNLFADALRSGAKAGVVGGLADWFAVTALFRRPLGLPIPHTAIIPAQKERLGRALARFVTGQVFTEDEIDQALQGVNLPVLLASLLDDPATVDAITRAVLSTVPGGLERLEDGRAGAALSRAIPVILAGNDMTPLLCRGLRALVEGNCHQDVLSFLLIKIKAVMKTREPALRQMIEERVREQGGRLLGWAIGSSIATKVLVAASEEVERIDPLDSDIREGFTRWVRAEIERMETDAERGREISAALRQVVGHETVLVWGNDIWKRMRDMIAADAAKPDGWSAGMIRDCISGLATRLREDPATGQRLTEMAHRLVKRALPYMKENLGDFIARVVGGWDADAISDKLELRVGRDLQYVRINGTLVGFLAGAGLSLLLSLCFGIVG